MNNKQFSIVVLVVTLFVTIAGGTLAYFNFVISSASGQIAGRTQNIGNNVTLTAEKIIWNNATADSEDLVPTDITTSVAQTAINAKCEATSGALGSSTVYTGCHLYRIIATSGTNIDSATLEFTDFTLTDIATTTKWHYAMWDTSDASNSTSYNLGNNVAAATSTGAITSSNPKVVFTSSMTANTPKVYYLLIYVENEMIVQNDNGANDVTGSYNGSFTLTLGTGNKVRACFGTGAECSETNSCPVSTASLNNSVPNAPVLNEGMIPVTIANDGTVTTVSTSNPNWYDYSNQEWANAVLVKESGVRTRAQNKVVGTTIDDSDILAYYVWIPRFKYAIPEAQRCGCIPNANENDYPGCYNNSELQEETTINYPRTIDIVFEAANATKSNGTATGTSYYTHPAFTFGSEELPGFWVGKFEATGNATTPTILPNAASLMGQNVSVQFATSLKFAGGTQSGSNVTFAGSNTYGLTSTVDSHMMKNSEWGAVLYLSHSNYGVNNDMRINAAYNYNNAYTTGCGANTVMESYGYNYSCDIVYGGSSTYPQSTTGNISGIFDMSGGASDRVMGHWSDSLSSDDTQASGFTTLPERKYIDIYPSNVFTGNYETNMAFCTLSTCGGHALYETVGWYSVYDKFADENTPWFKHGSLGFTSISSGAWGNINDSGESSQTTSFRSTIVARGSLQNNPVTITLDNADATTNGTSTIYARYNNGIYLDSNYTNEMTTNTNNITIPQRINYVFGGYYDGNTKLIDENGYITSAFTDTLYSQNKTLSPRWLEAAGVPTYMVKYISDDSTYTSGTWTKDGIYIDLAMVSTSIPIKNFQYSTNNGSSWNNLTCGKSNGIITSGNVYNCQETWSTDGDNTIIFRTIDDNDTSSTETSAINIKYDSEIPTSSVSTTISGTTVTATVTASDNISGIDETHYYFKLLSIDTCGVGDNGTTGFVDNENSNVYSFNATEETDYYICSKVYDNAGNVAYSSKYEIIENRAYLKVLESGVDFKATKYRTKIKKVEVADYIDLTNSVANWNLTNDGTNTITGWITENIVNTSNYDLYIGSEKRIFTTNLSNAFNNMSNVTNMNLSKLYTKEATIMANTFTNVGANESNVTIDLGSNFNTTNVVNMSGMFTFVGYNASNFNLNLGNNFDTSNVTDMYMMFEYSTGSTPIWSINLGNKFNTSNVVNMAYMFASAGQNIATLNLNLGNNFNTSNVENMYYMFASAGRNTTNFNLNLGNNFDTSNVITMADMFYSVGYNATNWSLNLGDNFDTSNVENMYYMFAYAGQNANELTINLTNKFSASNATNLDYMFYGVGNHAKNININLGNNFNAASATNIMTMFGYVGREADSINIDLGNNFNASMANSMYEAFYQIGYNGSNINIDLGNNFNASSATNMYSMFAFTGYDANNVNIDLGNNFNASGNVNMMYMFEDVASNSNMFNLSFGNNFNASNVTNMYAMFLGAAQRATNLTLNFSGAINTSKITSLSLMFWNVGADSTNFYLDLGDDFDTNNVTDMSSAFYNLGRNATNFTLHLGNKFTTNNVMYLSNAFYGVGEKSQNPFVVDLSNGEFNSVVQNTNTFNNFGLNGTIYVKNPESQSWIINNNNTWNTNFNVYNVVINNINYELDGGSFTTTPQYSTKNMTNSYTLPTPTKTGYTFIGWTGSNGSNPEPTVVIPAGTTEILRYIAVWSGGASIPTYSAKYVSDDSAYNGSWTNNSIYIELSTTSTGSAINAFKYSIDNGDTWNNVSCDKSGGIIINGNEYKCQSTWTISGNNNAIFKAIDNNNIETSVSGALNIKYDSTGPTGNLVVSITGQIVTTTFEVEDTMSGVTENYYFKLLTSDTCGSGTEGTTGFIDNGNNNEYSFNANEATNYYVCAKVFDNSGNIGYVSRKINISNGAYLKGLSNEFNPYRKAISKIEVVDYVNLTNAVSSWNLATDGTDSIKGWIVNNSVIPNNYDLYIGSEFPIYALNLSNAFNQMSAVSNVNLSGLNTQGISNLENTFNAMGANASSLNVNLGDNFNTSSVVYMSNMFSYMGAAATNWNLTLGNKFNTINVMYMSGMFRGAGGYDNNWSLNLGNNFNTSNVWYMDEMFYSAGKENVGIDLGNNFNTAKVTNMYRMFYGTGANVANYSLNFGNQFDTRKVKQMGRMFQLSGANATNYELHIDFNTINVTDIQSMFVDAGENSTAFNITLGNNFNVSNVNNMSGMFEYAGKNAKTWSVDLGNNFNAYRAKSMTYMFEYAGKSADDFNLNMGDKINAINVNNTTGMFREAGANATNFNLYFGNNFGGNSIICMDQMFQNAGQNAVNFSLNLGNNFNTSNANRMQQAFANIGRNATNFRLDLGNKFNTAKVITMFRMFVSMGQECTNFSLNLGNYFNTSNTTNMEGMFQSVGANATNWSLQLGNNFNTYKVTNMNMMFAGAGVYSTNFYLNIGNKFNMSNVTRAIGIFEETGSSTQSPFTIDLSAGNFDKITNIDRMFNYFGNNKATIYVKDSTAKNWLINNTSNWAGSNFNSTNILIK